MKFKFTSLVIATGVLALTACGGPWPPTPPAYWQRVEDNSALYLTGPKAQQALDEHIALCVHEVEELVELDALRGVPRNTNNAYHSSLEESADLKRYGSPAHVGDKKVSHTDFHDFESCMRYKGWERVKVVRYQVARTAEENYKETREYQLTGKTSGNVSAARAERAAVAAKETSEYNTLNK